MFENVLEKKSGEWTISRKMARQKEQEDYYQYQYSSSWQKNKKGDKKGESNDNPEIPNRGINIRHSWPAFGEDENKFCGIIMCTDNHRKESRMVSDMNLYMPGQKLTPNK